MQKKKEFFLDALHVFILISLVFAQPLYVMSRNAEFFVTRHSKSTDVISLILVIFVLLPLFFVLIEVIVGLFSQNIRKGVHYFTVAGLLSLIALIILKKKIVGFPGTTILSGAVIIGILTTFAYIRFQEVRKFLTILFPALFIFPYLFLFNSPVNKVAFPEKRSSIATIEADNLPPIVMVVFDEFPITSLMNEERRIDPIRYPNFAVLAEDSIWFRNDTTVAESTVLAVPAILSGSYPKDPSNSIPAVTDYPHNLFTLLGDAYEMRAYESHTMLCPETLCEKERQKFMQRMSSMLTDLSIVYLHIILPSDLATGLPVVTQTWKGFGDERKVDMGYIPDKKDVLKRAQASYLDRPGLFAEFLDSISKSEKPTLYFLHVMLPHVPWEYFPSGKKYTRKGMEVPGLNIKRERWSENEWLVIQGYQRHLLQVGFVDKLLGDLLLQLKSLDLYDKSLIVVTTDHGVNFWPDNQRRNVSREHPLDILSVPLFIKKPNQKEGIISDRPVESIDILPTIADVLDIHLPWPVGGHSALDQSVPGRNKKIIYHHPYERIEFDADFVEEVKYKTLKRKLSLFGSNTGTERLFKIGLHSNLLGKSVSLEEVLNESDIEIEFDQASSYDRIDPDDTFIPALITGQLFINRGKSGLLNLFVSVNGTIRAVTQTFDHRGGEARFSAIVPESSFKKGKNEIEVFIVSDNRGQLQLMSTKRRSRVTYSLATLNRKGEFIKSSTGESIPIVPDALEGSLDIVNIKSDTVDIYGWAADVENTQLPEALIIFINGNFFYAGRCNTDRSDVVKAFGNKTLLGAGFQYTFPLWKFNTEPSEARIFAISKKGVASELRYPEGYKWGKKS
jgi:hypothetical protein